MLVLFCQKLAVLKFPYVSNAPATSSILNFDAGLANIPLVVTIEVVYVFFLVIN